MASLRRRQGGLLRCCNGMHMAAGAALGILCTALLLGMASGPATHSKAGADAMVLAMAPDRDAPSGGGGTGLALSADRPAPLTPGEWDAAVEAALLAELARAEAELRDAAERAQHLAKNGFVGTPVDPETAALAEAALDLSRRDRRELQRRLALAEHDPQLVDGIFGPATRAAIAGWQMAAGLQPTGFFDEQALTLLERQTEDRYRDWMTAEQARDRRRQRTQLASNRARSATRLAGNCQRLWSGEIAYGQNMLCDFRGLRENVALLFRSERS